MSYTKIYIQNTYKKDDDLILTFLYEIYDDNGSITESGIKTKKYEEDMEISDNGVKLDYVGFYKKDDDDNKVYQQGYVYTLTKYFYTTSLIDEIIITVKKTDDDPEDITTSIIDDYDNQGIYSYDDDDISLSVNIGEKYFEWTPKNGDKGIINFIATFNALYYVKETMNVKDMMEHQHQVINCEHHFIVDDYKNQLDNKIDDTEERLEVKINNLITEFTTLDGSKGSYYKDGTKVKLAKIKDLVWTIDASFHYTDDRYNDKILYKIHTLDIDSNGNEYTRHMLISQNLISEVIS